MLKVSEIFISYVHCRTGSLENYHNQRQVILIVHCRTGSLEII